MRCHTYVGEINLYWNELKFEFQLSKRKEKLNIVLSDLAELDSPGSLVLGDIKEKFWSFS